MGSVVSCAPKGAGSLVTLVVYVSRQAHCCKYVMKAEVTVIVLTSDPLG